jgi:hypothetical protein
MMRMAGDFTRRVRGYAKKHRIPCVQAPAGERKDARMRFGRRA